MSALISWKGASHNQSSLLSFLSRKLKACRVLDCSAFFRSVQRYNILYDLCYTSFLKRAIKTQFIVAEKVDRLWIPVVKSWRLNERHYGALQGLNKKETALEYGDEQVKTWRRSFDVRPPQISLEDPRFPGFDPRYAQLDPAILPQGESLDCLLYTSDAADDS